MIKKEDIRKAISLFKEWDNNHIWDNPTDVFKNHTLNKSDNAKKTAAYILKIMEDKSVNDIFQADNYDGTLWIINASYYRIFFLAQYLLALDNKKLPKNIEDIHKTTELALMYYFIIKGSDFENKKDIEWKDITHSRLSKALELMKDAKEENQELTQHKAKIIIEHMESERIKRNDFTYGMTVNAELAKAKTSIERAREFEDIVKSYIKIKGLR